MLLLKRSRSLLLIAFLVGLSSLAIGQTQFAGKWHTKKSSVTGKHSITVNVVVHDGKASGEVVLVNPPDGNEIHSDMLNADPRGDTLEFETKLNNDTFYWRLTLEEGNRRGLLHGSIREMLIDEKVLKGR